MRELLVEGFATFGLIFLGTGTGACVVEDVSAGCLGVVGVGMIWARRSGFWPP